MLFVGLALLAAAALALLISSDAGSLVGLTQDQTGQILPAVILLMVLVGSLFSRRMPIRQILKGATMWGLIMLLAVGGYAYRYELASVGKRLIGELAPEFAVVSVQGDSVTFKRGFGGSFFVRSMVNGQPVRMVFDTGASAVVLTFDDATEAGIDAERLRYVVPVQTANGTGRAALVTLNSVTIGNIERTGIQAFVMREGDLETSLLGMSFLETLSGYSVSNETLQLDG